MSDNRTAEHKTLEDCKNEIARKHHWEKWSDLLYTGMDEEILLLYHAEATEMFYSQQTARLREELQRVYELVKKWHNQSDANEQCWKETVKDYNTQREVNKSLREENEKLKSEAKEQYSAGLMCERILAKDQIKQLQEEVERVKGDVKRIAVDFFYWWHNQPGTNTEQGFDKYIETERFKALSSKESKPS